MPVSWAVKELITALKFNYTALRRMTRSEMTAQVDSFRLAGDLYHNDTSLQLEQYRSGNGATWKLTKYSNSLFRETIEVGQGATIKEIFSEELLNAEGLCNHRLLMQMQYKEFVSLVGKIDFKVTDGTTAKNTNTALSSNPTPVWTPLEVEIDIGSYAIDAEMTISIDIQNVNIKDLHIRGY